MALRIVFDDGDRLLVGGSMYVFHTAPARLIGSGTETVILDEKPVQLPGNVTVSLAETPALQRTAIRFTAPSNVLIQRIRAEAIQ